MGTGINAEITLRQRAIREFKELVFISLYLYITLGAVIMMKTAVLHSEGVAFTPWGVAIVKAVVLAKFMMIGHAMKLGERPTTSPLMWPTLHRAFAFLVLLIIMTTIEEAIGGLFHHRSIAASLGDLFGARLQETLASFVIMLLVLIPYSAFLVLSEVLGEGRLARMFFVEREPTART
jgi:magnesium-transporting ATPase (P-type)